MPRAASLQGRLSVRRFVVNIKMLTFYFSPTIEQLLFSLGSWVAVQRKEYKLFLKGKQTKMTRERIQRLESVGFEWVAKRGE